jgi:Na+/H+-dicarboxylate symporter
MQIMVGLVVGIVIGWLRPDWGNKVYFLRDIFINLIKSIIAPLVFSTIVVGIAGAGALRKVGRMGVKALIYFEIVTTAALIIGLAVVNFMKPGAGITLAASNTDIIRTIGQSHPKTLVETLVHVFPSSVIDSMVRGDVLQIVAFSVLFALAVSSVGEKGTPIIVGFVMPTGYSFNLTGSTLYLAMASVFVAQAAETTMGWHMGVGQQITMMLTLMLTSKGVAGVPRASLVILLATLNAFVPAGLGPVGIAVIFGIDELMDMGRTCVNVIGNCLATIVVARWEREFDDKRARIFATPEEAELDLKSGDVAFANAVAQGD